MIDKKISVLIVDDSITIRSLMSLALRQDPRISVVGTAATALDARDAIIRLRPDVITLDVEMPKMNGIEFLDKIMRLRPMPVVMVSGLTSNGTNLALQALEIGAVECVAKPQQIDGIKSFSGLADTIVRAASAKIRRRGQATLELPPLISPNFSRKQALPIVAVGASTGGVEALIELLKSFPENCPPTLITQHMPRQFSENFARRLNQVSKPHVLLASELSVLETGKVFVAPGGDRHLCIETMGPEGKYVCRLVYGEPVNGHRPSVDELFFSVSHAAPQNAIGVILTGMENDGAKGLLAMRKAGARTLGQDAATSVIYGMPKAAFDIGAVEKQLPLSQIGPAVMKLAENFSLENIH